MRGTWISVALLVGPGFSDSACRKNADPAPRPAPAMSAEAHDKTGKDAGGAMDAGPTAGGAMDTEPTAAAPEPGPPAPLTYPPGERVPIESLFEVMYTPGETLPDKLQRRIRFRLKDKSRAPIALHHIIDIPKPDGGREVFALYEFSVYEDCVQGYANRKQGRDHCLGKLESLREGDARLNRACVAIGAVRAVFGPPGPGETADTSGSLAITSIAFTDALCEVRSYNRLLVADVDGDEKLEMYVDITTSKEVVGEVRYGEGHSSPTKMSSSDRHLYVLSGDNVAELSLDLGYPQMIDEEAVELRDMDGDGHVDVIQTKPCYVMLGPYAEEYRPCESEPRQRIAYLYDVKTDSYKAGVAVKVPAEKPAAAAAPAPESAPGAAPEPAQAVAPAPVPPGASKTAPQGAPPKAPSSEAPDARTAAMRLHDRAMKSLAAKQFEDAAQIWREAEATDPTWSWPPYNLACIAALQGHPTDAIAQLRRVIDRAPDVDLLRRLDTDRDLGPVRDLPAFQEVVGEVAKVVLAREFSRPSTCFSMSFTRDGAYRYSCAACCYFTGTYSYARGRLQLEIATVQPEAMNGPGEPRPVHVHGTYRLRAEHGQVCFDRIAATGDTDSLPLSPLPDGCWE